MIYVHVSFEDNFQAMDKLFMEKYGCYCPIRTKFPGVKDCPLEKLSLDQKLQAWSKYSITTNRFILFIFKNISFQKTSGALLDFPMKCVSNLVLQWEFTLVFQSGLQMDMMKT